MSYMSYCRFEGTKHELAICLGEVQAHIDKEARYEVSENEIEYFKDMVYDFIEFCRDNNIIKNVTEINKEVLKQVCDKMRESYDEEEE